MKGRKGNKGPGDTTTYKLPVINGEEGKSFYKWFNKADSINRLITEALKLKFMMDQLKAAPHESDRNSEQSVGSREKQVKDLNDEMNEIDIIDVGDVDLEMLTKTLHSIKR